MKRTFSVLLSTLLFAFVLAGISSCESKNQKELKAIVEELNKNMPMEDNGVTVNKVTIDEEAVVYRCSINVGKAEMAILRNMRSEVKKALIKDLQSKKDEMGPMLEICKEEELNIVYRYTGKNIDDVMEITINPKDI